MKNLIIITSLSIIGFVGCSQNAEVTWHKLCDAKTNKASLDFTVPLYSDSDEKSSVVEFVPVGTVVKVFENRNHNVWKPRNFIRVQTKNHDGFMNPQCFVINQDPENSVWRYSKGLVKNYMYFYDPNDKAHYPKGYEWGNLKGLSKEKIPLGELTKGLEEGVYVDKNPLKPN